MATRRLEVANREVLTDGEGYLVDPADWSEAFARAQAAAEGLELTAEHWELIRFLRSHFARHGIQASVRDMIKHFRTVWGKDKGSSRYLHRLFPRGGPQKQGNRIAGLLRTKGEH
jgi:tRNA 2-thiouridine synthesizing protein E